MEKADLDRQKLALSDEVVEAFESMVATRRDLHTYPEVAHQERRTQQVVLDRLKAADIRAEPLGGTGVVGLIEGRRPGKVVLLRADMDALPVAEENDVPYRSSSEGVMHACGHDAHVAILLGVAEILARRGLAQGVVKLMFQPAEEGAGGARAMIEAGVLEDPAPDSALAFHVWSGIPIGRVAAVDGPVLAGLVGFEMTVTGKGTHAAMPEHGVDPVAVVAQIITAAQALVTRHVSPADPAVLSFTAIHGGDAFNVIPERVTAKGTIRAFDDAVRTRLRDKLVELAQGLAEVAGARVEFELFEDLIPTVNDAGITAMAREAGLRVVGADRLIEPRPQMVSEDFALVLDRVPGAMVLLGAGNPDLGAAFPHHHPRFDIDERSLAVGAEIALDFVERFLG
jgi:amidohydrolase